MAAQLFYMPFDPVFTSRGLPAGAAQATFFYTGTTTRAPIYADGDLTIRLENPVRADALGRLPTVYLDEAITYRVRVLDKDGAQIGADADPYIPGNERAGPTGPADSTYTSLTALKAAPQSNTSYTLATADGRADYSLIQGDFTGKADDIGVVALAGLPLSAGALVRAGFTEVSVKDVGFGARGDFIQDDTDAIQAAIDYVWKRGGGIVKLPTGVFKIRLRLISGMFQLVGLVMRPGVYVIGQGPDRSVIKLQNDDPSTGPGAAIRIVASQPRYCANFGLRDLGVTGNYSNQPRIANQPGNGGNILFGLFDAGVPSNVTIDNVASFDAYGQGIQVAGLSDDLAFGIRITRCDVYNCSFIGIQVSQFTDLSIMNNKVFQCGDNGIDVYGFNNNFSAPAITSDNFTIQSNTIIRCQGAGVFPETVRDGLVLDNRIINCINGVQCNNIAGIMQGVMVRGNYARDCQNGYAHTAAHTTRWVDNKARGFTYGGFILGTVGGEASYVSYEGFDFKPSTNQVPLVRVPDGVMGSNFNDPGLTNWITQADVGSPTPRNLWFVNNTATEFGSRRPVFASSTEGTPTARLRSPVIDGQVEWSDQLPVFADNATAYAAIGAKDYKRDPDGPTYRAHS